MMTFKRLTAALVCLALVGCGSVNQENYDKLKVGMQYEQIIAVLGEPDNCGEKLGVKSCTWGDEKKHIKVSFAFDKASIFSQQGL